MGYTVDADDGNLHNPRADADDIDQAHPDDEDGLNYPAGDLMLTIGAQPTVNVIVTNTTGTDATLSGWIDFDNDGIFDDTERAEVTVLSGTKKQPVTLNFPTVPNGPTGAVYARFRLGSDAAASTPVGHSDGGEVEDYVATIFAPADTVAKSAIKVADQLGGGPPLNDSDNFGSSLAPLGDLDGDGVVDLAIGAMGDDDGGSQSGAVYIALMNADGTIKSYQRITKTTDNLPLGDYNYFGIAMANVGDLDRDGVTDLAVLGSKTGGASDDSVHFLFLNSDGTVKAHQSTRLLIDGSVRPAFASMAVIGDLDGDGTTELAFGAPDDQANGIYTGAVYVMFLDVDGSAKRWQRISHQVGGGPQLSNSDFFGESVASVGDLNQDGTPDLAVGARGDDSIASGSGAVHILFLDRDGTATGSNKISDPGTDGTALVSNDYFGSALYAVGDLDGDGTDDLVVGASGDGTGAFDAGAVYILLLQPDGSVREYGKLASDLGGVQTLSQYDSFGHSVAPLGDLNGDGRIDLAVGAYRDSTGGTSRGAVHILQLDDGLPLGITDVIIHNGGGQRSTVQHITVQFNETATIDPGAFDLRTAAGTAVDVTASISVVGDKTQALLTFSGAMTDPHGSLIDNNYRLTVWDTHVRDAAGNPLDGDGDGIAGSSHVDDFFRLLGDGNGDRVVNLFDFAQFRSTFGQPTTSQLFNEAYDHDDSGMVDLFDFAAFRSNFGKTMPQ